jgi:hypothetical protein
LKRNLCRPPCCSSSAAEGSDWRVRAGIVARRAGKLALDRLADHQMVVFQERRVSGGRCVGLAIDDDSLHYARSTTGHDVEGTCGGRVFVV